MTDKTPLKLREYGRNIQKIIEHIKTIENKELRTSYAYGLVGFMKIINPSTINFSDNDQKFWDDLFIMAGFDLDINSPYPMPDENILYKKPAKIPYNLNTIKYRHYGYTLELFTKKAALITDTEQKENAIIIIGKMMKMFHNTWNRENFDDVVIIQNIKDISENALNIDIERVKNESLFGSPKKKNNNNGSTSSSHSGNNNNNRRKK
ncbi:MAG: DUF4290 domain-containing protein [Chitinophagaceae bacterium]|nr:DUF4290 domain-containing protein [Chitinophagaceae bacterium]